MAKRKKKRELDWEFLLQLQDKKIPILTLDERWHALFPEYDKTAEIKRLEKKLNDLMKMQGKHVNDLKDLKNLKNKLLEGIVASMGMSDIGVNGRLKEKKQDKSQKLIKEINEKIQRAETALEELPQQLIQANKELLLASVDICMLQLEENETELEELNEWIDKVREELKIRLLKKQDLEIKNADINEYMRDILGKDMTELLEKEQKGKEGK